MLAGSFALASSNANLSPYFAHIKTQHQLNPELFLPDDFPLSDPISISEVYDALRRCGNSSPGPDGIHYEMLRRLPLLSLEGILVLFNQSWSFGVVPHSRRRAIVIPITKKGKPPSQPSSYRPISLTSTLCKLLERVIATRLRWFLESKNMLNQYQAGFRKGRGSVDHIVRLTQDTAASSTKKQMTLGVFLDLEKAFDMVWREGLIKQHFKTGVKGKPLEWIHNFLQDRSIQVRVGSALSEPLVLENGTPQDSVLGPLLFIIMMNAIPNPCKGVELSMYADDIALWTTGTSSRAMTTRMQKQLNKTAKFLSANGFKISASKSQAVLFTNSRVKRSEANIRLRIGKEQIPLSPTATFLGIVLDAILSWSAHAEAVKTRCMKRLNAMRAISGSSWDASKSNPLKVYRATIRSVLDYGCEVIDLGCKQITDDKLQYQALKICCGGMKGTSASSLQVECGELLLDLRRKKLMTNLAIKNESVKSKYIILDGRKFKSQARLHFKMKKRGETTPYEKVESLLPADFLGGIEEETPIITSLETEETGDRHLESLLRSRQPSEDAGSKRDDRGSPGMYRL